MAVRRENILRSARARDLYLQGVNQLSQPNSGVSSDDLVTFIRTNNLPIEMRGSNQQLSVYDLFVFWHVVAASIRLRVGSAAHQGPVFLPWHRMYLLRFEEALRQATNDPNFALPYWDWAADGALSAADQIRATLWTNTYLGPSRGPVNAGPLAGMRVRLWQDPQTGILWSVPQRPLDRAAGQDAKVKVLPKPANVQAALSAAAYDMPAWSTETDGHRNILEGWVQRPQTHNRVHVWVGGDMSPGSSPNDPVFFLNHCNVDRIWERWMTDKGRSYAPGAGQGPAGHRINDTMVSIIGAPMTPQQVLDVSQSYTYDTLN